MKVPFQQVVFQSVLWVLSVNVLVLFRVVCHDVVCLLLPLKYPVLIFHYPVPVVRHAVLWTRWWKLVPLLPLPLSMPSLLLLLFYLRHRRFPFLHAPILLCFLRMLEDERAFLLLFLGWVEWGKILAVGPEVIDGFVEVVGLAVW